MRHRFLAVSAGLLALAAALYSGLWFVASGNLRDAIENWAVERRTAGWSVAWDELSIGGFPFALRAEILTPRIAGPNPPWQWRGPNLVATARPWNFSNPSVSFPGRHKISVMHNGSLREYTLTAAEAFGAVKIRRGRAQEITATFTQIDIVAADGQNITTDAVSIRLLPNQSAPPEHFISVSIAGLKLPDGPHAVLGRDIHALDAELRFLGISAFKPSLRLRLPAALGDWRDHGGTIEIVRLHLNWGGVVFDGDGTVALDAMLQPIGAMQARIRGYRALVDGLVEARLVPARDANMTKFVLGMVARATSGGKNTLTVPVTVQDRQLFIGPVKSIVLPRIDWKQ